MQGIRTGLVAKWHLGDNAPCRPQDRGFQEVLWHKGGGIGQAPDFWMNDQFDDVYERNGKYEKFTGYATDVWFRESMAFVERNKDSPFFPLSCHQCSTLALQSSRKMGGSLSGSGEVEIGCRVLWMITNLDHNVGLLRKKLDQLGLAENTIFIFTTDNGTAKGRGGPGAEQGTFRGFNAGMFGQKSTIWEGGHRVPFFIHWPAGGLVGGEDRGTSVHTSMSCPPWQNYAG